ncbi:MAG TPA: MHYT domain-containing protein [Thermoanaerobaculia bacterium]|nr:MHYT domain-containing protein [Thermoanaerobaculia bacterium]
MPGMQAHFDPLLIALSYAVSVFGAYTSLRLAHRMQAAKGSAFVYWLAGAAFAMGGGAIWAMHFIGMIAYRMAMPVRYDALTTIASMAIAVVVTGVGLWIVGSGAASLARLIAAGTFTGLGVAGMHYLGMAAMRMPADLTYDRTLVAVSVAIAVVAASAAFWIAFNMTGRWQQVGSAFVMGAAVCGMHYTGMAAATMVPNGKPFLADLGALSGEDLAFFVFLAAILLLAILLFITMRQRLEEQPLFQS